MTQRTIRLVGTVYYQATHFDSAMTKTRKGLLAEIEAAYATRPRWGFTKMRKADLAAVVAWLRTSQEV